MCLFTTIQSILLIFPFKVCTDKNEQLREEGSKGRGYMYTCGGFILRFDRKQQKFCKAIILQLKNNLKKEKKESVFSHKKK